MGGACALLPPSIAAAAGPAGSISVILSTSQTTSLVHGTVASGSVPADSYDVAYDLESSSWCQSGGGQSSPSFSTARRPANLDSFKSRKVSVQLSGLSPGSVYCAELIVNPDGQGGFVVFRAGSPNVSELGTAAASTTTEQLSGTINPVGSATSYSFDRAPLRGTWCESGGKMGSATVTPGGDAGSGSTARRVSGVLTGLTPGVAYCWAIVAANGAGASIAFPDGTTSNFEAGKPTVMSDPATRVTRSRATLHGAITTSGDSLGSEYFFVWDRAGSSLCRSGGKLPENRVWSFKFGTPENLRSGDSARQRVSARIGGLRRNTTYCYEAVLWSSEPQVTTTYTGRLRRFRTAQR